MNRLHPPAPSISLGVRVAVFTSLSVLAGILLAALLLEGRGRKEARAVAEESLQRTRAVTEERLNREGETLERLAVTVSRDPRFFALLTMRTGERGAAFRQALGGVVREFQRDAASEIFDVTDSSGTTLAASARPAAPEENRSASPLVRTALSGHSARGYRVEGGRLYRLAVVPVTSNLGSVVGTLTLGSSLEDPFAANIRGATGVDVILVPGAPADTQDVDNPAQGPVVSTLTDAGTRSLLATMGKPARPAVRWTARDARVVSIAKSPALAVDAPLSEPVEGGTPRLLLAAPVTLEPGVASLRETLLAAGAVAALLALAFGFGVGARLGQRLVRLGDAAREAGWGNFDVPLPDLAADEAGELTREFDAMRVMQRREIDRLVSLDRMKTDYLNIAAQEILHPAKEIEAAAEHLVAANGGNLRPETLERLQSIRESADHLARLAHDLGGMSVVTGAAGAPHSDERAAGEAAGEVAVHAVAMEAEFVEAGVPGVAVAAAKAATADPVPAPGAMPTLATVRTDIAALVEGVATDAIVSAAERGIEVAIAVEPNLDSTIDDAAEVEATLRSYVTSALAEIAPGGKLSLSARRTSDAVEIDVDGGNSPLRLTLPLS